jgi:diguanylate cyclase (GGDEF)-like protein
VTNGRKKTTVLTEDPTGPTDGATGTAAVVLIHPAGPFLGRRFDLAPAGSIVGRQDEAEVHLDHEGVSRRHARIWKHGEDWMIEDLGSTNGTFVEDKRVPKARLSDGDLVRIGTAILKFLGGSAVEAAYHEAIYKMAIHDALTGVSNRRMLIEFLDREVARSVRYHVPLSLVLFDIDHFKKVNDEHGHLAGDAILREIGRRLRPRIRKEDLLARYGGEEFACVLTGTPRMGALVFAKSLHMTVGASPFDIEGGSLRVTVSVGIADIDGKTKVTLDELMRRADAKLYEAKKNGRNQIAG